MPNDIKDSFLKELDRRFGPLRKLADSQSLFDVGGGAARVYVRYSKIHPGQRTFYGLRDLDLRILEGHPSVICFLWDNQQTPLLVPYSDYESVFQTVKPAEDGQFKAQVYPQEQGTELYIANAGRFNVEDHLGWSTLEQLFAGKGGEKMPDLSHTQIQTLLGSIGSRKGFDIWVPTVDRGRLDWSCTATFSCCNVLPPAFEAVQRVLQEIDVVWIRRGSGQIAALFEVEHSTPIYSGLLRFNDVHLTAPTVKPRFNIVANYARRDVFASQLSRPTFRLSGLSELCSFLEYANVFRWHQQLAVP